MAPVVMNLQSWNEQLQLTHHPQQQQLIMDYLVNGVDIGIRNDTHNQPRFCTNLISARGEANRAKIQEEMNKETRLDRRAGPFSRIPFFNFQVSPIGTVPKNRSSTKLRVIHHLSYPRDASQTSINSQIADIDCDYLAFTTVCKRIILMGKGCMLAKFDINEAFKYIRVKKEQHYCLGMRFNGLYYYERVLPFGLKSAPALFELFATAINRFITHAGVAYIYHYMDDFICVSEPETALKDYEITLQMFRKLNIILSPDKLQRPSTRIEFLGLVIDTNMMQIQLPIEKLNRYRMELSKWRNRSSTTKVQLQSLLGKLVHASRAVNYGRSFYQHLLEALRDHNNNNHCSDRTSIKLSPYTRNDIKWWYQFIHTWNGIGLIPPALSDYLPQNQHQLYTDACQTGMGAFFAGTQYTLHSWDTHELNRAKRKQTISMPYLELLSLIHSINIWKDELKGSALILHCDCKPVVDAINTGRSYEPHMMDLLRTFIYIINLNHIFIHCIHIAGVTNIYADLLSRSTSDQDFLKLPQLTGVHLSRKYIQPLPIQDWSKWPTTISTTL
jgi:hypothetical protein